MENTQHSIQKKEFIPKSLGLTINQYNHDRKTKPEKHKEIRQMVIKQIESYKKPNFGSFVLNNRKYH